MACAYIPASDHDDNKTVKGISVIIILAVVVTDTGTVGNGSS